MSITSRMYKLWYIYVSADYTAKGMNEPQLHVTIWVNSTHILSERKQNQKVDGFFEVLTGPVFFLDLVVREMYSLFEKS